jgi:hypothetical protein
MNANTCSVVGKPGVRCIGGPFCGVCQPDYDLALAMGLHPRLGKESPVAMLLGTMTADLLRTIIYMTRPKREVPAWLFCDWDVKMQKRRRAIKVLNSSRAAKRRRENERVSLSVSVRVHFSVSVRFV